MKRFWARGRIGSGLWVLLAVLLTIVSPALAKAVAIPFSAVQVDDPAPPTKTVKLIFVHHSCGGNWLADPSGDQPSGGLGIALRDNNYFVSATNYGWGPDGIADATDIPNWPAWFTGPDSSRYLDALYNESGQNIGDFGAWSRIATDPGGENEIIMFKSCYPNSDLYGNASDPPASGPSDQFTVSNAKAVYNDLLTYFETRQDKLFIVITAPPMAQGEYPPDTPSPAERAANARAFNQWLVDDWLANYPYHNVAVFDYYNVLTSNGSSSRIDAPETNQEPNDADWEDGNHHRWRDGTIQHIQTVDNDTSAYPTDSNWDSHPTTAGHQKATAEFVPLLNVYYNRWKTSPAAPRPAPSATPEQAEQPTAAPEEDVQPTPTASEGMQPAPTATEEMPAPPPPKAEGVIDDMEAGDYWESFGDGMGSTVQSGLDADTVHGGSASLRIEYDVVNGGWGDCGCSFEPSQDWSNGDGISLWLHSDAAGQPVALVLTVGGPAAPTPFTLHFETTAESAADWVQYVFSWADFTLAEWADEGSSAELDLTQVIGYGFNFNPSKGILWVDDIRLAISEVQPREEASATATNVPDEAPAVAAAEPTEKAEPDKAAESDGGFCATAVVLPLAAISVAWALRKRQA